MQERLHGTGDQAAEARLDAGGAAEKAGVQIRQVRHFEEIAAAARFFADVWASPANDRPISSDVLAALGLSGNYVACAFDERADLVGATVAWAAIAEEPELHSHVTGVSPKAQHSGIGRALKLDQRAWALEHGIGVISWTFDPLVRRNAAFNLRRLGARAEKYIENLYGEMEDVLNAGDESDRLFVRWHLLSASVVAAAGGRLVEPVPDEPGRTVRVPTPEDIVALRHEKTGQSQAWRLRLREELGGAMAEGWTVLGLDDSFCYVLWKEDAR